MSLIHVKEIVNGDYSVTLQVDGRLDDSSIPTLDEICNRYLKDGRKIHILLGGLYHISRDGRKFLDAIKDKVVLEKLPSFIKLDD